MTRVAVKTGLFATCFKTLPSSPSSHLQSHSWCSVNSDVLSMYIFPSGAKRSVTTGYAVVGNCFETAFQIHHVDIGAVLGKIFLISPPNSAAANDKVRGRAGYVLHFVNDLLYGRIVYCSACRGVALGRQPFVVAAFKPVKVVGIGKNCAESRYFLVEAALNGDYVVLRYRRSGNSRARQSDALCRSVDDCYSSRSHL